MNSKSMKRWQAKKILDMLRPTRGYLHELKCRMEKVGFLPGDPLFRCVEKADNAMLELCMALHYMTCDGGMGFNQGSTGEKQTASTEDGADPSIEKASVPSND